MQESRNELFPVFLRTDRLRFIVLGGGKVALEKLTFLFKSSPQAQVTVVSPVFLPEVRQLIKYHQALSVHARYRRDHLQGHQVVIAATNDREVNAGIYRDAKANGMLVNVADTPEFCDFYLGGIVTKGNVKIAISTNGHAPSLAKSLRIFFEEALPAEIDQLAIALKEYRRTLGGQLQDRVKAMNEITQTLSQKNTLSH